MKAPFFRTEHNYDREEASLSTALKCEDPTLAQQHFKDECDINVLFARYLETGEIPQVMDGLTYGNFEGIFDFQTAMNAVRTAEGLFQELPARIKNRFANDPQKMLEFMADDNNREEAEFLGLTQRKEPVNETRSGEIPQGNAEKGAPSGGTPAGETKAATNEKP